MATKIHINDINGMVPKKFKNFQADYNANNDMTVARFYDFDDQLIVTINFTYDAASNLTAATPTWGVPKD